MWIHPVVPVLSETRPIVLLFNRYYKQAIEQMKDANVVWLDFLDQLLAVDSEGKAQLKDEYRHDGTHLHPGYLQLIEQVMNTASA
jgi:hypothetical protein